MLPQMETYNPVNELTADIYNSYNNKDAEISMIIKIEQDRTDEETADFYVMYRENIHGQSTITPKQEICAISNEHMYYIDHKKEQVDDNSNFTRAQQYTGDEESKKYTNNRQYNYSRKTKSMSRNNLLEHNTA